MYKTDTGFVMPDRRKPEPKPPKDRLGCSHSVCVFHPERTSASAGTTGICTCLREDYPLSETELAFLLSILGKE